MSNAIVAGSIGAVANHTGQSISESFMAADAIVLMDVSGSMATPDSRGGQSRYDVACQELSRLQAKLSGKIAVVGFSDTVMFAPYGAPFFQGGGTDLAGALKYVKLADGAVKFIVVSDGQPDSEQAALAIAKTFSSPISVVYVGPEGERHGAGFLARLAKAAGGQFVRDTQVDQLAQKIEVLLISDKRQE